MTCHFARLLDDGEPIVGLSGQLDSIKMSAQTLSHAIYELFRLSGSSDTGGAMVGTPWMTYVSRFIAGRMSVNCCHILTLAQYRNVSFSSL